tara:strand:+ start:103 stop:498 length:396 start_codon:yes stop_codon:yes gene_type:complete
MNDISALLVATTVLSIGGMGMIMYKSTDETYEEEEHDETMDEPTSAIDLGNVWNSITGMFNLSEDENVGSDKKYKEKEDDEDEDEPNEDEDEQNEDDAEEEYEYYERPKKKQQRYKTKRNRKTNGNTKRRY